MILPRTADDDIVVVIPAVIPVAGLIVSVSTVVHRAIAGGKPCDDFALSVSWVVTVG